MTDRAGGGPDHGPGAPGSGAAACGLPPGAGLLRLARPCAAPALDRRQAPARQDIEDGTARPETAVGGRRHGVVPDPWLAGVLARKPRKLVAVALANRMARILWALVTRKETYRAPAAA